MVRGLLSLLFFSMSVFTQGEAPWRAVAVPRSQETEAVARLASAGIEAVSWSTAVVEVSAFEGLETVALAELSSRLTPQDPRWDPWLEEVSTLLRPPPEATTSSLWIPADRVAEAQVLLGTSTRGTDLPEETVRPSVVTGWAITAMTLLYGTLAVTLGWRTRWSGWDHPRRWLGGGFWLVLLLCGVLLWGTGGGSSPPSVSPTKAAWLQHRWFQETWPWGSEWADYTPGKAWTYRSYEHQSGRLAAVDTPLTLADETWARAAWEGLDRRHVARIFGFENP